MFVIIQYVNGGKRTMTDKKTSYQFSLLDHMIQRSIAEEMEHVEEEALAQAIQILLEDKDIQNLH